MLHDGTEEEMPCDLAGSDDSNDNAATDVPIAKAKNATKDKKKAADAATKAANCASVAARDAQYSDAKAEKKLVLLKDLQGKSGWYWHYFKEVSGILSNEAISVYGSMENFPPGLMKIHTEMNGGGGKSSVLCLHEMLRE